MCYIFAQMPYHVQLQQTFKTADLFPTASEV